MITKQTKKIFWGHRNKMALCPDQLPQTEACFYAPKYVNLGLLRFWNHLSRSGKSSSWLKTDYLKDDTAHVNKHLSPEFSTEASACQGQEELTELTCPACHNLREGVPKQQKADLQFCSLFFACPPPFLRSSRTKLEYPINNGVAELRLTLKLILLVKAVERGNFGSDEWWSA